MHNMKSEIIVYSIIEVTQIQLKAVERKFVNSLFASGYYGLGTTAELNMHQ